MNLFKNFYTWFHSHLLSFTPSSAGLISFPCQRAYTFSSSPPSIASCTTISPTSPSPPSRSVFLSVYLSTFTVTALESQESQLPLPSPLPRSRSMLLSPSPSFTVTTVKIHIGLCIRGMEGPPYSPSRQPALSCSSHAQPPTRPALTHMNTYTRNNTLILMSNTNQLN